jgi:hypothetical protein
VRTRMADAGCAMRVARSALTPPVSGASRNARPRRARAPSITPAPATRAASARSSARTRAKNGQGWNSRVQNPSASRLAPARFRSASTRARLACGTPGTASPNGICNKQPSWRVSTLHCERSRKSIGWCRWIPISITSGSSGSRHRARDVCGDRIRHARARSARRRP